MAMIHYIACYNLFINIVINLFISYFVNMLIYYGIL